MVISEPVAKGVSLYLMFCIGFKGGVDGIVRATKAEAETGVTTES